MPGLPLMPCHQAGVAHKAGVGHRELHEQKVQRAEGTRQAWGTVSARGTGEIHSEDTLAAQACTLRHFARVCRLALKAQDKCGAH